jgi:hypothetical protein
MKNPWKVLGWILVVAIGAPVLLFALGLLAAIVLPPLLGAA